MFYSLYPICANVDKNKRILPQFAKKETGVPVYFKKHKTKKLRIFWRGEKQSERWKRAWAGRNQRQLLSISAGRTEKKKVWQK